jgi:hypothetical protein
MRVNTNAVNVAVVDGKTITEATELRANPQGHPVRIKAVANGKYILAEGDKGVAPENITVKRVGKDLHVALEGTDPDQPQLIIEGFFDAAGQLVGVAEDGAYHEYIASDAEQDHEAAFLMDGDSSPLVLGAEQLSGFDGLVAATGIGWFWPALLGLGALAIAGAVWGGHKDSGHGGGDGGGYEPGSLNPTLDDVEDNVGDNIGKIENGGVTDDTTPTFGGTGNPGDTIIIKDGDNIIGEVVVGEDGKWTFEPETPLAEGGHDVTIIEKDPEGNESTPTPGFEFTIDTTAPDQSVIKEVFDDVGATQGLIPQDGITDDNTPTLKGTAEPGATLEVFANGDKIGSTVVDQDGNWTFTPDPALADGDYSFTTVAVDEAGNRGLPSLPYDLTIDTLAPGKPAITSVYDNQGDQTGNLAQGDLTDDSKPDITGTAEPGSTVIIYDNGVEIGRAPTDDAGNWTFTPTLPLLNGPHDLTAKAEDKAGNVSEPSDAFDFDVLTGGVPTAPAITGVIDAVGSIQENIAPGGVTDDKRPTITGTGEPGTTVTIYDDGKPVGTGIVGSDGRWSVPLTTDLHENLNNLTATTTDSIGNVSPETGIYPVILDTTPPAASAEILTDDVGPMKGTIHDKDTTDDNTPTASGNAEPGTTVIISDNGVEIGRVPVKDDGTWTFTPSTPLPDGDHSFSTVVEDAAGNQSPKSDDTHFTVDTSKVEISITQVDDNAGTVTGPLTNGGVTDDTTPTVNGLATPNSKVNIYDGTTLIGTVNSDAAGKWTFTPTTPLTEGDHSLTATVVTAAGGESAPTSPFNLEIDITAPAKPAIGEVDDDVGLIQGPIVDGGTTDDTTPTLSGGGLEPGDTVTIIDNGDIIGTAPVNDDGSWEFTPNPPLNDDKHDFTIIVTDPAGNSSEESDPYTVIIDTKAPGAPAITSVYDDQGDQTGNIVKGSTTDDAQPDISGTAEPGSTVIIYDKGVEIGRAPANDAGVWTFKPTLPLTNGGHDLTAKAQDAAGNISAPSDDFDFDVLTGGVPTAPAITGVIDAVGSIQENIAPGGVTDDKRPTITGTGEPGTTVTVYDDGKPVGTGIVGSDGRWSVPLTTDLHENLNNLTATTTDSVGNVSPETGIYPVILDTTPPAASAETLTDDVGPMKGTIHDKDTTDDNTPTASGNAEPGTTVIISDNGVEIGRVPVKDDGTWTFTPSTPLPDGDHSFSTVVEDAAGNQSPKSDDTHFTVDTSNVEISITEVDDNAGTVTGPLTNGGVTDDTTPTVNGLATPNSKVNIYDGTTLIGTVNSNSAGKWTFTPTTPLTEGDHSLTATVVTAAGGESAPTSPFNLEIDTTAPAKPAIGEVDDDVGLIQGPIVDGGTTDDTTPTLSGGGLEPGDTVTIIDNGDIIGTAPVKDDGSWEFTPNPPLNDEKHDFTIIVTDPAGNSSEESDPYTVIIDTKAPGAPAITSVYDDQGDKTGNIAKGSTTDDAKPDISGTAEPGSTVIIYDKDVEIGRAPVDDAGNWTFTPTLPLTNGGHDLTAKAQDVAGNISAPSDDFDFNLMAGGVPPAPAITGVLDNEGSKKGNISPGGVTDDKRPTISGTGEPGSSINVYDDGKLVGTGTVGLDGHWTVPLTSDLHENLNNLTAQTVNAAGNLSPETGKYPIILDTTAPSASAETLTDDVGPIKGTIHDTDTTDDNTPTASGTAEPGTTVIIFDKGVEIGRVPVKDDGTWSFTPSTPLPDGDHVFSTIVEDAAGNQSPKSDDTHFTIDTSKVEISITEVNDNAGTVTGPLTNGGVTDDTTPTINGLATPNSKVNIYDGTNLIGTVNSDAAGKWTFTPTTPLIVGDHSLTATVVTAAGGESDPTSKFDFEIDLTAPGKPTIDKVTDDVGIIQGPIAKDGTTDDSTPTLSGGGLEPGDTVTVKENGHVIGTAPVKDDGTWEFTPNPPLNDGKYDFTIIATDPAGNASEESDKYPITIDTSAPVAKAIVDSMSKDSGANHNDFLTNDGSAGRLVQGSLTAALAAGEKVQVSTDGGKTWLDALTNGKDSWSLTDNSSHGANWEIQTRVVDLAGNQTSASKSVTLDQTVEAPSAVNWDGKLIHVNFAGEGFNPGDTLRIMVDGKVINHALTADEISSGTADHAWTSGTNAAPLDIRAALIDEVGNLSDYRVSSKETANTFTENFNSTAGVGFRRTDVGKVYHLANFDITPTYVYGGGTWGSGIYHGVSGVGNPPSTNALILSDGGTSVKINITNPKPVNTVSMTVGDLSTVEVLTAIFYGADGKEVYRQKLTSASGGLTTIHCDLPYGQEFKSFDLILADADPKMLFVWIDDIKFGHYDYVGKSALEAPPTNQTIVDSNAYIGGDENNTFSIANVTLLNSSTSEVHGNGGVDTLKLTGKDQVLDLTKLGQKIESIEVIDLTGSGNNTLNLSLSDVLQQGGTSLFTDDGHTQMMVKGNAGDKVNLDDLLVDGTDPGNWASAGNVTVGGVVYEVYRHDALDAELLVQQGVQTNLV